MATNARNEQAAALKKYVPTTGTTRLISVHIPSSLLVSGNYSDLVVTCGADIYNVHKAIVCSQSTFFRNAEKFPVGKVRQKDYILATGY
jgi:hypothetical protein